MCAAFQRTAAARPDAVALRVPGGAVEVTWAEYAARVRRLAAGLATLGVGRCETVGLMMVNRPEFHLCDAAAMHLGAAAFSVYNTAPAAQIAHVFGNAGNRVVCCEAQFVDRIREAGSAVEHVICVDAPIAGTTCLAELEELGDPAFAFDAAWRAVGPGDLLTLIYTSGTTGPPKGVELTHANMLAQMTALDGVMEVLPGDRALSYLPSAHIADRWFNHYIGMTIGTQVTCVPDPKQLFGVLPEVRPTLWGGVPRIFEKLKAALDARFASEPDAQRRAGVAWALDVGLQKVRAQQAAVAGTGSGADEALLAEYAKADAAVWAPLRRQLGLDQVRSSGSGAAPLSLDVLEFFAAMGLPINEMWGMSELACLGTRNRDGRIKHGTVGLAIPSIELRLAEDGELLCRGPMVMRCYRGEPEKTAEAIDAEGWLHTGDIASIDDDGYVTIIDRKKEMIINAAGKNMSPANIEGTLKGASMLVGQAFVVGDRRPYNIALLVLDPDASAAYATAHGLPDASPAALCRDPGVHAAVAAAVELANNRLSRPEQVKRFTILPVDWLPAGDELTPTMKLKRRPIAHKYAAEIKALYAQAPAAMG
jgi:long-subunit acyl-CoA synthetase (AMP-forming)